ncbi:ATP-dependent protease subunit [Raphidocelis subcapitata]|uniref:ATP-dependent protease subunit n=1 Tax=Raphidocelis subcapitata TaxID=307507 RepID=A0A2V0PE70_9CHLO|nr:ATP-dependent protease subunit [Raphidocelis subcapitata]|eukprot:GBF98136.1 ATP-dependent protease subunit [Raphidocelis subcapitata]
MWLLAGATRSALPGSGWGWGHAAARAAGAVCGPLSSSSSGTRGLHAAAGAHPHGTTVLCVRKDGEVVMLADGQLTLGDKVLKHNGRKIRRLALGALGGFAGSTADGLTLFERLETKLEQHPGQLRRAAVELAKNWRQDRVLRHLQATMIIADAATCLEVSGSGEVLEPSDGVHAIGSGARFAIAAARALMDEPSLPALDVAHRAMRIAADKCIYTNDSFLWERIGKDGTTASGDRSSLPHAPQRAAPSDSEAPPSSGGGGRGGGGGTAGGAGEDGGESSDSDSPPPKQ